MSAAFTSFEELPGFLGHAVHGFLDRNCILAITDVRGDIVFANQQFCRISGYSQAELLGQNHRLLRSGHHPPAFYHGMWSTIARGDTWRGEICNRAKDGHLYWVDSTLSPIRGPGGRISHYLALRVDITARMEAEAALERSRERHAEIRRMESLGRMADGVLHDLNNLLASALAVSEMLEGPRNPQSELLAASLGRMAHLTRNLRDFSTGRPVDQREFPLGPLVAEACKIATYRLTARGALDLEMDLTALDRCWVRANEGQIFEVMLNLLTNAIEAVGENAEPRITVTGRVDAPGVRAVVLVEDSGPGVPELLRTNLFEPYLSSKGQGRGLGLSVARKIARAHGGELALEPSRRGARFRFELPARPRIDAPPASNPATTPRVVLIGDDDPGVCRALSDVLAGAGFRPVAASHPDEVMVRAEQYRDVLTAAVLDSMGTADGFALLKFLRGVRPNVPVVLVSASLPRQEIDIAALRPAIFLPKPFTGEGLISAVRELCERTNP